MTKDVKKVYRLNTYYLESKIEQIEVVKESKSAFFFTDNLGRLISERKGGKFHQYFDRLQDAIDYKIGLVELITQKAKQEYDNNLAILCDLKNRTSEQWIS